MKNGWALNGDVTDRHTEGTPVCLQRQEIAGILTLFRWLRHDTIEKIDKQNVSNIV